MLGSWLGKTVTTTDKGVSFTWSLYEYDGHDFESQLGPPSNVGDHLDLAYLKDGRCYVRINPASNPDQPGAQLAWVLEEAGGRVHDNGLVLTITNTGVDQQNKTRPRWRSHRAFSNAKSRMKRKRRNDDDSEDGLKGDVDPQVEELSRSVSMETSLNPGLGMLVGNSAGFPALTFILKADARNRFTAFRDSWNELLTGRPTYELGLEILEALLAQDALVYGLPSEWVMPVEELTDASSAVRFCIAEDFAFRGVAAYTAAAKAANARSDALQHPKNVYKQEQARKEEEKAEQLQFRMVNCATGEGQPGSFQELISSQLSVSGFGYDPGDTFMSLLELHASEEGLGRFHFRIPGYLKPACSSSNKRLVSRHEFDVSSAITPSGAFTAPHADYLGAHVPIYHIQGVKLWLLWPGTPSNIRYMSAWVAGRTPAFGSKFTIQCIKKLEGLITWIATDTGAIVLPPFTYHAVLTIGTGIHSGGPVYSYGHALSAFQALEIIVKEAQSTHKPSEYQMLHHELDENLECWSCCIQASHGRTPSVLPLLKGEKRTEEQLKIAEAWRASKAMVEAMKKVFAST